MHKNNLGLKLLELRQEHELTQKQLCEALNISRANYSYFENGRRMPDISTLQLIASYYDVSLDLLVSGSCRLPESDGGRTGHDTEVSLVRHLKAKHIPVESVMQMSKADFDFLMSYKKLTADNKAEMTYLMNYKLKKQSD